MIRVVLLGATGRLGQLIQNLLVKQGIEYLALPRHELKEKAPSLISFASQPFVILDVSIPDGSIALTELLEHHSALQTKGLIKGIVIGCTGHSQEQREKVLILSKNYPLFFVPNFSIGMFVFEEILNAKTSSGLPVKDLIASLGFDTGLIDVHHNAKKDSPSGTALQISKLLGGVKTTSLRVGHATGEHRLIMSKEGEELSLTHTAYHRGALAEGAVHFLQKLWPLTLAPGVYDKRAVLGKTLDSLKKST